MASSLLLCVTVVGLVAATAVTALPFEREGNIECGLFEFYDHGTDSCEPCAGLCQAAAIQRTEAECQAECPDYLTSLNCTKEQYYDENVRSCSPCSELCKDELVTDTAKECSEKCGDYKNIQDAGQTVEENKAEDGNEDDKKAEPNTLHPGWIAFILVLVVVISGVLVILAVMFKKKTGVHVYTVLSNNGRGKQPVQVTLDYPVSEVDPTAPSAQAVNGT